jgi:hypothetical protein
MSAATTASRPTASYWSKNRRVELVILRRSDNLAPDTP